MPKSRATERRAVQASKDGVFVPAFHRCHVARLIPMRSQRAFGDTPRSRAARSSAERVSDKDIGAPRVNLFSPTTVKQVAADAVNAHSCDMQEKRAAQQDYVRRAMEATGLDATNLARRAGLSSPTLTRFLNAPDGKYLLSVRSLSSIAAVCGLPLSADATGFEAVDETRHLSDEERQSIAAEAFELLRRLPRSEQERYLEYLRVDIRRMKAKI